MSDQKNFWKYFSTQQFEKAIHCFESFSTEDKSTIFSEFFQKSAFSRNPIIISILYRELHNEKTFDDFHQAWFPLKEYCHPIKKGDVEFQQVFPAPTRVYNAINMENPKEILSVGFTWIDSEKQREEMLAYVQEAGKDDLNQERHDNIGTVAHKLSSTMYELKTSDNLGVPFSVVK